VRNEGIQGRKGGFIDAHHHVWDLTRRPQPWLDEPGLEALRRTFGTADLVSDAAAGLCGRELAATVLVQCLPLIAETEELLRLAEQDQLVAGVVGWLDLTAPDVGNQLDRLRTFAGGQLLVGVRHLVQAEPDPRWLLRADVRRGLDEVAERDLCYDLLVLPHQLPAAADLAEQASELRLVVAPVDSSGVKLRSGRGVGPGRCG
jgi:L-fuconolactonase